MKNIFFILLVLFVSLNLSGCQTTTTYYLGAQADEDGVISLVADQTAQQQWQDLYITVDFDLQRSDDNLNIDGVLSFSNSPKANYTRVWDLKLKLFFLDKDMRVVSYLDIARSLGNSLDDKTKFNRTLEIQEGAVAFTFGYEGSFIDDDPESPSTDQVWKLPKRNF